MVERSRFGDPRKRENALMPCSNKDHFVNFWDNILPPDLKGENPDVVVINYDPEFAEILRKYDGKPKK
jgi:hypothetical protein